MLLQLKNGEANLRIDEDSQLLLDGEGRLMGFHESERLVRRSYDDRWIGGRRPARGTRSGLDIPLDPLPEDAIAASIERTNEILARALGGEGALQVAASRNRMDSRRESREEGSGLLRRALSHDRAFYASDGARLRALVGRIPVLPPDRYRSLYVLVSRGCRYNRCLFCELYRDRDFANLSPEEVGEQTAELLRFFGRALPTRTSVFLGDASGLAVPHDQLLAILERLKSSLPPRALGGGIHSFADVFITRPRTPAELAELRERGLRRLYIGLESASRSVLDFYRKPHSLDVLREEISRARQAGIHCALMVIAGGAGARLQDLHVAETLAYLRSLDLGPEDRVFLSPLVVPRNTGFRERAAEEGLDLLDPAGIERELAHLRRGLQGIPARVSRYELRSFLYR